MRTGGALNAVVCVDTEREEKTTRQVPAKVPAAEKMKLAEEADSVLNDVV